MFLSKELIGVTHQKIINLYHSILPELSQIKVWGKNSKSNLSARWKEDPERQNLEWWESFFTQKVKPSNYLMGKVNGWQANLGWLVGPENFEKVMNGFYENRGPDTGSKRSDKNLQVCEDFINDQRR